MKLIVTKKFTDKYDHSIKYEVGDILHTEEVARVENLVSRGLVKVAEDETSDSDNDETGKEENPPTDNQGGPGENAGTVEDPAAGQTDGNSGVDAGTEQDPAAGQAEGEPGTEAEPQTTTVETPETPSKKSSKKKED